MDGTTAPCGKPTLDDQETIGPRPGESYEEFLLRAMHALGALGEVEGASNEDYVDRVFEAFRSERHGGRSASNARISRHRGRVGRPLDRYSELGEFIVDEMSWDSRFEVVRYPSGVRVRNRSTGDFLDVHQLRAYRTKLEMDRAERRRTRNPNHRRASRFCLPARRPPAPWNSELVITNYQAQEGRAA